MAPVGGLLELDLYLSVQKTVQRYMRCSIHPASLQFSSRRCSVPFLVLPGGYLVNYIVLPE